LGTQTGVFAVKFADLFNFNKFVAPVLTWVIYWIGLVLIVLLTLSGIADLNLSWNFQGGGDALRVGGALIGGVFAALLWRVICELWLVTFSINERLGTLVELKKAETSKV
jgi:hypothetical protein